MLRCPMCGHVCYRTPERPDWSCPYHGRVNLLQAKMEKQAERSALDENIPWEAWKSRLETADSLYQKKVQEVTDLQTIFKDFIDAIEKLGIS